MLITISGLYGSGGNELGEAIAKDLGYELYNDNLIKKAVEDSGVDMLHSTLSFYDEADSGIDKNLSDPYANAILNLQMDVLPIAREDRTDVIHRKHSRLLDSFLSTAPLSHLEGTGVRRKEEVDALRFAQAKVILDAAEKGNGVFLGRCASYVLKGRVDTLNIFTHASLDSCKKRISEIYGITDEAKLETLITTTNRRRAYYYETFTSQKWDDLENYDFCIDVDYLGYDGTLQMLKNLIEIKEKG